ncbi:MAG: LysR family transcriptional regulator [Anaerolineaceae bacterium]|nr:LysR family transcriptional regulator [Anaerolineaceae bacterium]
MPLNLHLLRIFTTVASSGSFSQAARHLYISQPAVSRGVQELERQLNLTLVDRSMNSFTLTEGGRLLYQHGLHIFAAERAAEVALEELHGLVRGQLALGASQTIGTYLLPPLLRQFHRRYAGVRLMLDILNTHQILERLVSAPLDLAFVEGPVDLPNLIITPWRVDTLVVIAAPDNHLAHKQPLSLTDLLAEPFIMREVGSGTRENIERELHTRGLQLNTAMELGGTSAIKEAVAAGLGISIVSDATIKLERQVGTLVVLDVPDFILTRTMSQVMVAERPLSRAATIFQSMLLETTE